MGHESRCVESGTTTHLQQRDRLQDDNLGLIFIRKRKRKIYLLNDTVTDIV